ncbi:MAG: SCP2 sterol-binding domain-containing protein [Oscillospiraceae bacterium]|nr:SCP2 sterol-binding domain-containing protein [Oscillospiraceae bacterium]
MTFNELLEKVRITLDDIDFTYVPFMAIQINITGKDGGVFYIEIKDGKATAEPYEYIDRSCALTIDRTNFLKLLNGKLDPVTAYTTGKLKVDGDLAKALEFSRLIKNNR